MKNRNQPPYNTNRFYTFIEINLSSSATTSIPLGDNLARTWSVKIGWFLANLWDEAAQDIYNKDALQWDAPDFVPFTWLQNIFKTTFDELKNEQSFSEAQAVQEKLFNKLKSAESELEKALRYIRDHYEGGTPPF